MAGFPSSFILPVKKSNSNFDSKYDSAINSNALVQKYSDACFYLGISATLG
ncbi:hypothetical protein Ngar_c04990 [Candidatus Nitrososphaera gargensis Ga9.2]|uniref:Uncharacterized protein n=1 Tax=Nitrososphaera gargensis (strain Ga9.2) TaxID=1237085 RepID=K0IF53_NITGG|nr:hypothetical protein Ngar_c04990 [Candidatus Nitrososphaera gargensis Ga9.2]